MSELISGKEALIALANGEEVVYINTYYKDKPLKLWGDAKECNIEHFLSGDWIFRLKPRTVNLNGVEVGQLCSSLWNREKPNKVTLEFKTEEDALHFNKNALNIFNGV